MIARQVGLIFLQQLQLSAQRVHSPCQRGLQTLSPHKTRYLPCDTLRMLVWRAPCDSTRVTHSCTQTSRAPGVMHARARPTPWYQDMMLVPYGNTCVCQGRSGEKHACKIYSSSEANIKNLRMIDSEPHEVLTERSLRKVTLASTNARRKKTVLCPVVCHTQATKESADMFVLMGPSTEAYGRP